MKYFILLGLLLCTIIRPVSQNIPNGGFEEVIINSNYPLQSYPVNWLPYHLYWPVQDICFPELPQGELTDDCYSGNWAIKMETYICTTGIGSPEIRLGSFITGNHGMWAPKGWSVKFL